MKTQSQRGHDGGAGPAAHEQRKRVTPAPEVRTGHSQATSIDASPRMAAQRRRIEGTVGTTFQRQAGPEEELQMMAGPEEEELQMMAGPEEEELQMMAGPEEEELQMMAGPEEEELQMMAGPDGGAAASGGGSSGLPEPLRGGIEALSGVDTSDVTVHRNSARPAELNALAYAQGSEIHLGPGQEKHLPHEAWHVVQQRQGRVEPTLDLGGVAVNDDAGLEREADVMGARAAQRRT